MSHWAETRNIVLDRVPDPPWEGEFWGLEPQFTAELPIAKLLWPLLSSLSSSSSSLLLSFSDVDGGTAVPDVSTLEGET